MNLEDRLKEAFEQEAQHLHAPSGSPETAIRRGRRRRASNLIGGATLILALVGGTAAGVQLLGDTEDPPEQDLAATTTETAQTEQTGTVDDLGLPTVAYTWDKVELPVPPDAIIWDVRVGAFDDGFVAIGRGDLVSQDGQGATVFSWQSDDGHDWQLVNSAAPFAGSINDLLVTEDGFIAVVESSPDRSTTLYESTDGTTWTGGGIAVGPSPEDDQYVWLSQAASGDGVTVVAGVTQRDVGSPPIALEEFGVVLNPPNRGDTFRVTDGETGELITEVPVDEIYGGLGRDLTVFSADGEIAMVVPQDEALLAEEQSEDPGEVSIEKDGMRLSLDYLNNRYEAVNVETGEIVAAGDIDDVYRSHLITITHPETGEVIVEMTFDEFLNAEERSYSNYDYRPESAPLVLVSADGVNWQAADLPADSAEEMDFSGLAHGASGFVLELGRFGREVYSQETWQSDDGLTWNLLVRDEVPRRAGLVARDDQYFGLTYGNRGEAGISRSEDGSTWTRVFEAGNGSFYLNELQSGGLGLVALGQETGSDFPVEPITISKDGRTLLFDYEDGRVVVTEDSTGDILTEFSFDVFDTEPPPQFQLDEDTQEVTILDEAGTVLMVITEEEGEAAAGEVEEPNFEVPIPIVLVSDDGEDWRRATNSGLDLAWSRSLAVGDEAIVLAGESVDAFAQEYGATTQVLSDEGSSESPVTTTMVVEGPTPAVYLWVGRPA